jgi:hypothetical protein
MKLDIGDFCLLIGLGLMATGIGIYSIPMMMIIVGAIIFIFGLLDFFKLIKRGGKK